MTAAETAKASGFKSLSQVASLMSVSTESLRRWHKDDKQRFEIILLGCRLFVDKK